MKFYNYSSTTDSSYLKISHSFTNHSTITATSLWGNSFTMSMIAKGRWCLVNHFIIRHLTCLSDHSNFDCLEIGLIFVFLAVNSIAP